MKRVWGTLSAAAVSVYLLALGTSGAVAAATPTTWCGGSDAAPRDRKPDLVAGPQIQVVYAHPAGAPDRFSSLASPIASDVAAVGAWWRGQDDAREPRFDLYPFDGCAPGPAALDLLDVTLPEPASYYALLPTPFTNIVGSLPAEPRRKYLVYWDAPVSDAGTCGEGAGEYALVYMQACSTNVGDGGLGAAVAAHELLHALGAVQSGAKHECPAPDTQHACDSSYDVMYPYISGPIDSLFLDVGRDDYYGVGGAFDVRKSPWLAKLDVPARPVNVSTLGSGRVVSDAGGIDCPGACATSQEQGLLVMLTAKPQKGSRFAGWSGACRGRGKCYVTVGKRSAVRARFISVRSSPRG